MKIQHGLISCDSHAQLHKDNWTIAPYPLERHGYVRADSWLDQYKRILKLFNDNVK